MSAGDLAPATRRGAAPWPRRTRRSLGPAGALVWLVLPEVVVQLPLRYLRDVLAPLLPLRREEVLRDVIAERARDHVVLLQLVARLVQIVRQVVDAQPPLLAVAHLPDVLVHRLSVVRAGPHAIDARR